MLKKRRQIRVVLLIIDDKAGIDRHRTIERGGRDGVGVAAQPSIAFEDRGILSPGQQSGR